MCDQHEALAILSDVGTGTSDLLPVQDAWLYGSYARGDYRDHSDVDIMVVSPLSDEALRALRWDITRLASDVSIDHDVTVSLLVRSAKDFDPASNPYHHNIIAEGIRWNQMEVSA